MSQHTVDRLAWSDSGRCSTADPELFFPPPGADTSAARSICRGCPVRRHCLDYALETGQKHGIWGGMTESQRRRLRRPAAQAVYVPERVDRVPDQQVDAPVARPVRHLQLVR